jgi:hypothetical protein
LEILKFGCYETETIGTWELIIWEENFTKEMFDEAKMKLENADGPLPQAENTCRDD